MSEPIPPIAYRPPVPQAVAPVTPARRAHPREREAGQGREDERRDRHPAPTSQDDDDAPREDGHVDVLA